MRYLCVPAGALLALLAVTPGPVRAVDATPAPALSRLQIRVLEGDGAVHRTSNKSADHFTVLITDAAEKPISGATVSFQLPDKGPGGQFAGGLRTDVQTTDERGLATSATVNWNDHTGSLQVKIMAMKDQALAGTLSSQYLTEYAAATASPPRTVQVAGLTPILPPPVPKAASIPVLTTPEVKAVPIPAPAIPVAPAAAAPQPTQIAMIPVNPAHAPKPEPTGLAAPEAQPLASAGNTIAKKAPEQNPGFYSTHKKLIYTLLATSITGVGILTDYLAGSHAPPGIKPIPTSIGVPIITIGGAH